MMDSGGGAEPAFPSSSFPAASALGLSEPATPNLRETVKTRLLNDMIHGFTGEVAGVVMCVDSYTVRVLSSVCKMSELLEDNITLVENITMRQPSGDYLRRQPLPELAAIYFIQPTVESVNRLIADFRDKKKPMYRSCHLYFSSKVSDALFNKIKSSAAIGRVQGFKELNLELVCTEVRPHRCALSPVPRARPHCRAQPPAVASAGCWPRGRDGSNGVAVAMAAWARRAMAALGEARDGRAGAAASRELCRGIRAGAHALGLTRAAPPRSASVCSVCAGQHVRVGLAAVAADALGA